MELAVHGCCITAIMSWITYKITIGVGKIDKLWAIHQCFTHQLASYYSAAEILLGKKGLVQLGVHASKICI